MSTTAQIQEIYVGLLARAADAEGLAYWSAEIDGGVLTIEQLRANIVNEQPEWQTGLGQLSRADLVDSLYANLFERSPDVAGKAYWVSGGGASVNADQLVLALVNGAAPADATTLANKTEAATYYTNNVTTYVAAEAESAVSSVDGSLTTLLASKATTNDLAGQSELAFTTSTTDVLSGTSSSEQFSGVISSTASKLTFNDTDILTDATSNDSDTLTISIADDFAASATPTVTNVENIVVDLNATTTSGTVGTLEVVTSDFTNAKTYSFDISKAVTGVTALKQTGIEDGSTITVSSDFKQYSAVDADGEDFTVVMQAVGTSGSKVTVDIAETAADVDVQGAGHLSVAASALTGSLTTTAAKSSTVTAANALVIDATASDGDLTISNAAAAVVINLAASGDISLTSSGTAGSIDATAGGTITFAGTQLASEATLSATGTSTLASPDALSSVSLSGNGAAAVYSFTTAHEALEDISVTGDQNVTIKVDGSEMDEGTTDKLILSDNSSGTITVEVGTTKGNVDTRDGDLIDRLEIKVNSDEKIISVGSGQTIVFTADQISAAGSTGTSIEVGDAAAASTNSVTIVLDDESSSASASTAGAVDVEFLITQAKTVTIDASGDTTSGGTANPSTITSLDASDAKSNVTLLTGANGATLAGAHTVGTTGTLTVTGSGDVALGSSTLVAGSLNMSGVSGDISGTGLSTVNVSSITLGSGSDTLTVSGAAGSYSITAGAGDDSITLPGTDYGASANNITIALGDGTDTLNLVNGTKLTANASGSVTVTGLEKLVVDATASSVQGTVLSGSSVQVSANAASATGTLTANVASSDTTLDFSSLTLSTAAASSVAGMTLATDASANSGVMTITGATGMKNTITGGTAADTLTGGLKVDTFVYSGDDKLFNSDNEMIDTAVSGSTGTDILQLGTSGTAVEIEADDDFSNLSSVEKLVASSNSANISITLGTTAETAGIVTVDLSADTTTGDANVINVAAYTAAATTLTGSADAETITGGAGVDTITGGAGSDTLSGGAGNDIFKFTVEANWAGSSGTAGDASINGGDGVDVLLIGGSATAFTIAVGDDFSSVTNLETIQGAANSGSYSVTLSAASYTAGVRTVDISAGTAASSNVINVAAVTGGGMTLTGSSTGITAITGGDEADIMRGGNKADTFNAISGTSAEGADTIVFEASALLNGTDTLNIDATDLFDFTAFLGDNFSINGTTVGGGTAISSTSIAGTADTDITGKLTILSSATGSGSAATATAINTEAELFALIDGSGDALSITTGKAVVIAEALGVGSATGTAGTADSDYYIYFIDTAADGAAGLSLADVTLVGNAVDVEATAATTSLTTSLFVMS